MLLTHALRAATKKLTADKYLYLWGTNGYGQMGNNLGRQPSTPAVLHPTLYKPVVSWGVYGRVQEANIGAYGAFVDNTGALWVWGINKAGCLGLNLPVNNKIYSPVQVGTLTDWAQVAVPVAQGSTVSAFEFMAAIKKDGTLWTWGSGTAGALGSGTTTARSSPVQVGTLTDWATVVAGPLTVIAVKKDGTLWSWGSASNGKLGSGTTTFRSSPVQVGTLTNWTSKISIGDEGVVAIKSDGTLWGWGFSGNNGIGTSRSSPTQIGTLTNWADVKLGVNTGAALKTDGTLWTWGTNSTGWQGKGNTTTTTTPGKTGSATDWVAFGLGGGSTNAFLYATNSAGQVWGAGRGAFGTSGPYSTSPAADTYNAVITSSLTQVQIPTENMWKEFKGVYDSSEVWMLDQAGALYTMGATFDYNNSFSQEAPGTNLSVNQFITASAPVQVGYYNTWKQFTAGGSGNVYAIKTDGTLWGWGAGFAGSLATGVPYGTRFSPVQIGTDSNWSYVSAGGGRDNIYVFVAATKTDGTLWTWGSNAFGQLGDGTTIYRSSPVQVGTLTDWATVRTSVSSLSGGPYASIAAVKTDGTLWAWGANSIGKLGDGTTINRSSPVQIGTLTDWSEVHHGSNFALGLKTNKTLWSWGNNGLGQLGNATTVSRSSPVQIGTLTDWDVITTGNNTGYAIRGGRLYSWGYSTDGQLGSGSTVSRSAVIQVGTLTTWSEIDAGPNLVIATRTDGTLWGWGYSNNYELGRAASASSPVQLGTLTGWSNPSATGSDLPGSQSVGGALKSSRIT